MQAVHLLNVIDMAGGKKRDVLHNYLITWATSQETVGSMATR